MVRSLFVAIALAVGVAPEPGPPAPERPPTPVPKSVLAVFFATEGVGSELAHVDPLTLEPLGRQLRLATGGGWTTAFSPDGRTLALGGGMGQATVELVDVRRLRSLGVVDLHMSGTVTLLSWERGYLFAVVDDYRRRAVFTIDPVGLTVQARHKVGGAVVHAQPGVPGQVVLLLAPNDRIGALRLAVVGGKGMASAAIPGFVGGWETERDGGVIMTRQQVPALVIDRAGGRALVVSGNAVAEVALNNLGVTHHVLTEHVSLFERFRNWLEPPAEAKLVEGASWTARWVGNGVFALTGVDYEGGEPRYAGLRLIDTRDWSIRRVDAAAVDVVVANDALLTWNSDGRDGVRAYDVSGVERFHILADARAFWVQASDGLVYAHLGNGRRIAVIDPARGRTLATPRTARPLSLVER
jgi:hypothetical protein